MEADKYEFKGKEFWNLGIDSYEAAKEKKEWILDAIFISHAHDDRFGYLQLLGNIPVVCSKTTEDMMKAISDVGNLTGFDKQLTLFGVRKVSTLSSGYFLGELRCDFEKPPKKRNNKKIRKKAVTEVFKNNISRLKRKSFEEHRVLYA